MVHFFINIFWSIGRAVDAPFFFVNSPGFRIRFFFRLSLSSSVNLARHFFCRTSSVRGMFWEKTYSPSLGFSPSDPIEEMQLICFEESRVQICLIRQDQHCKQARNDMQKLFFLVFSIFHQASTLLISAPNYKIQQTHKWKSFPNSWKHQVTVIVWNFSASSFRIFVSFLKTLKLSSRCCCRRWQALPFLCASRPRGDKHENPPHFPQKSVQNFEEKLQNQKKYRYSLSLPPPPCPPILKKNKGGR